MNRTSWTIAVVLVGVLALGLGNVAVAKKKPSGQDLYKEFCKPCHMEDSEAGEVTPMTLIMAQWERFFEEKYVPAHEGVADPGHDGKPVTEVISEDDLETIREWTVEHAADSEHPMTCG